MLNHGYDNMSYIYTVCLVNVELRKTVSTCKVHVCFSCMFAFKGFMKVQFSIFNLVTFCLGGQ